MIGSTIVVVLGMHRSGTSLVTECLKAGGLQLADTLLDRDEAVNRRGFWEDRYVVDLNEALLAELDSAWFDTRSLPDRWLERQPVQDLAEAAIEHVQQQYASHPMSVLKDPRLCRLLPFWLEVFRECRVDTRAVLVVRSPAAVAQSLQKRNDLPPDYGCLLWYRYMADAVNHTRTLPTSIVAYDALLTNPVVELSRIGVDLELNLSLNAADLDSIADTSLRHHSEAVMGGESCRLATDLYETLLQGQPASAEQPALSAAAYEAQLFLMVDGLLSHYAEQIRIGILHEQAQALVEQRDGQLAERRANEEKLGGLFSRAETVIRERESQIQTMQKQHEETAALYHHAEQVVAAQSGQIQQLDGVIARLRASLLGRLALYLTRHQGSDTAHVESGEDRS